MSRASLFFCLSASLLLPAVCAADQVENALVAIVNDEAVTQLDLEAALFDQRGSDLAALPREERAKEALQLLIEERLILQAAKQAKLAVEEALVENRLEEARRRFPSEEAFDEALLQEGLTRAMLRKRYRDHLMMQRVIEQEVRAKINVTPSEIARYYNEHPEEMTSRPRVRVRHLLIRITPMRTEAEALSLIEGVRRQIEKGTAFADAALASSEGPEAAQGGDMGWVSQGQLLPVLDAALFQLEAGAVSEPIRSDVGYHLLQVEGREPVKTWTFDEVELSIREKLLRQKFEAKLAQWLADLRATAYIVIKLPPAAHASTTN